MMKSSYKGISIVVLLTSFILALAFNLIWLEVGALSLSLLTRASVFGWTFLFCVIVSLPTAIYRKKGDYISFAVLFLVSLLMIANIMYYDAFGCQIPLYGYSMIGNLKGFEDSIYEYFNLWWLILPLIVFTGYLIYIFYGDHKLNINIWILLAISILNVVVTYNYPERFKDAYARLKVTHIENSATTVLYSPLTNLIYQYNESSKQDLTDYNESTISSIIEDNSQKLVDRTNGRRYSSIVIILVESLESFVIDLNINNVCITPNLTKFSFDEKTLYAPFVESEVGVARSMDAQLIVNCGLLPPSNEAFCFQYAGNNYPSIAKALTEHKGTDICINLTTDFSSTYNQDVISKAFGYKDLLTRTDFDTDPPSQTHVDDSVFLSQSIDKLEDYLWPVNKSAVVQIVSYSTHAPFRLPLTTNRLEFPGVNTKLVKYLNVVKYTDAAIGRFVKYLQQRDDYDSMLIVITGDHNAFPKSKYEELGIETMSGYKEPFIPLIILNSASPGIISHKTRQSSIYPTLLELLGLSNNAWPGVGRSVFNQDSIPYDAQEVSNYIIRKDLLR